MNLTLLLSTTLLAFSDALSAPKYSNISDPPFNQPKQPYTTNFHYLDISDFKSLSSYFNNTFILREGVMIELMEQSETVDLVNRVGISVLELWEVVENPHGFTATAVIHWANSTLKTIPGFHFHLKAATWFPGLDFSVIMDISDQFDILSVQKQANYLKELKEAESKGLVVQSTSDFFSRFSKLRNPMKHVDRLLLHLARHLGRYELAFWQLVVSIVDEVERLGGGVTKDHGTTCNQIPLKLYIQLKALGAKKC